MWSELFKNFSPIWDWMSEYAGFVSGFIIATIIIFFYHRFIGLRALNSAHNEVKESMRDQIRLLSEIVNVKLEGINVEKKDKDFFKKIKKYFNKISKKK